MGAKHAVPRDAAGAAGFWILLLLAAGLAAAGYFVRLEYAFLPDPGEVVRAPRLEAPAYDLWGRSVGHDEARALLATDQGRETLSPAHGAVAVDADVLARGRRAFYQETYRNEVFLTDVVGLLSGPLDLWAMAGALGSLAGGGTDNLRVALSEDAVVGGRTFRKGEVVATGLGVPRGSFVPLGIKLVYARGRLRAGVTCALCHAAVDPGRVVEGAPNTVLNVGLVLALAPNSAAYFANTDARPAFGPQGQLPPVKDLEDAVDATLLRWPQGSFDSTIDLTANPSQIPDAFTKDGFPYGWNGFASSGPFHGLTALGNNVHGQNSDATVHTHLSQTLFDIPPETYLALVLRNAAASRLRYDPGVAETPSALLRRVEDRPGLLGLNDVIPGPSYPKISSAVPDGVMISKPGRAVWELNNAVSAFENTLAPPPRQGAIPDMAAGRDVFEKAGCAGCHAGPRLTNNRIVPVEEIGTEPSRAKALQRSEPDFDPEPKVFALDTPVPVPDGAAVLSAPPGLDPDQTKLAMAYGNAGGYKVKSLIGLALTAPYLHDGGVAVGPDPEKDLGLPGTLGKGLRPDPAQSLRALVDRELRARVLAANGADPDLEKVHVRGMGHEIWVDAAAGFTKADQDALIEYLLWADMAGPEAVPAP